MIIFKFLLNIFILIDLSQNSIKTLTIIAKKFIFDINKYPILNDFFDGLTIYNNKKSDINKLTYQFKFKGIYNIYKLIPYNVVYLSIGSFDYETFNAFVDYITSSDFGIHSSLTSLQINLDNNVIDIDKCYNNIISLFTDFPKNLNEINLYTNLEISYNKIDNLLNKINYNLLKKVFIQFNNSSLKIDNILNRKILGTSMKNFMGMSSNDFTLNERKLKPIYYIERIKKKTDLILNIMERLSIKYNRNFMDYKIFLNIEKFSVNNRKKNYIISFK